MTAQQYREDVKIKMTALTPFQRLRVLNGVHGSVCNVHSTICIHILWSNTVLAVHGFPSIMKVMEIQSARGYGTFHDYGKETDCCCCCSDLVNLSGLTVSGHVFVKRIRCHAFANHCHLIYPSWTVESLIVFYELRIKMFDPAIICVTVYIFVSIRLWFIL